MWLWGSGLTILALLVLLVCEARHWRLGIWLSKPAASTGFLLAAVGLDAHQTTYGRILLVALALAWLGDVLLIARAPAAFLAGLVSFLLAHVFYIGAFAQRGCRADVVALACVVLALPTTLVLRWLTPGIPPRLLQPVRAYVVVITLMVAAAMGSLAARPNDATLAIGAVLFYLSDLCVARQQFKRPDYMNKLTGLPLYYLAQLLLAASTG